MDPTSLDCQPPIWNDGRFSPCVQNLYIENLIPIGGIAISLISSFLIYSISRWRQANERLRGFQHSHDNHAARRPPYVTSVAFSTFHGPYLTWLEGLLLVANLSAFSFFAISPPPSKQMPIGLFYLSIYCLILWIGLLGARKTTRPQNNQSDISLGLHHHLGPLYTLQWICFMIIFLSNFNDLAGSRWDPIIFLQGGCSTAILLLHATAPRVRLEASQGSLETIPDGSIKEASASLLSRWCFSWVGSVVWKALKTPLETTDLYPLSWDYQAAYLSNDFQNVAPARYRMIWRIYLLAKYDLLHQGIWAAIFSLMSFCPAVLLRFILAYMESPETMSRNNAWLCIVGLLITGLITAIADCQCEWLGRKLSLKLRAILINEVFTKVLRRRVTIPTKDSYANGDSKKETHASDGNIFNLMAVDAASISEFSAHTHLVWVNFPLQLTIASVVLYSILGISGILGVILMIVLLPLNLLISERQVAAQRKVLTASDARVQASNEAIKNIRTIKLCAWEDEFRNKVRTMRNAELSELRGNFFWWSISITVFFSLPFITTILTLFIYTVVEKQELETKVAFPALATFAVLRIPLDRMASSISFIMKSLVSVRRIEKFLKERETGKYDQFARGVGPQLGFRNASFQWPSIGGHSDAEDNGSSETLPRLQFQLSELDTNFQKEGLNVIFGPSGSGKSSMLLALLGEMELLGGKVNLGCSHLAYCPQEPWILNQSIRANILFGQPLDTNRYRAVLSAVSLIQDLIELDEGDMTLAGERGSRLSGGQKQRVALARALYSNSEILLLDDCLSALDHRTGRSVFLKAIKGPLMKNRTCILATHHTQLVLPRCDYGVCLDNGRVKLQGTATELAAAGLVHGSEIESFEDDLDESDREILASTHSDAAVSGTGSEEMEIARGTIRSAGEVPQVKDEPEYQEEKSTGAVSWSVIRMYLRSMGSWWFWIFVLVAFVCQQLTSLGTNLWVKKWAAKFDSLHHEPVYDEKESKVNSSYYLTIYGLIALIFALASFIRDLTVFSGALKASSQIFDKLLDSILYARLLFFDKVPFGQITNRFSKDIKSIDQNVTPHSMSTFYTFCSLATVMILISALLPVFLPVAAIICGIYYLITRLFINSARDLKRIEAVRQSPMYQHFGEALTGSVSIRAYGHTERFTEENHRLIDGFNEPNAMRWASKDWLTLRIASLSAVISWLTGTFLLWGLDRGSVNAGVAGLALTYAATFTENVLWFVELYSIVQQSFNSVERVAEYMQIVQEPSEPLQPEAPGLSSEWPTHGSVRFRGYTTSYSLDLDSVLRDLDIDIPGGQRVAIVGRTGAGKSSLALALIRVLEADTGSITIDGVDIASVSLKQLRETVTIVPQDPTLFDGSLRDNIDPFHKYSETELNDILRDLQLFKSLQSENLDHPAAALSQGQRQLVCIARALLRRSRVLVLDEATASIDHATDALIQSALRSTIAAGTTIITVAHRLSTIADYDKVVVLEAGRVVEQGSVTDLLAREDDDAFFHKLCEHSGDFDNIKAIAYGKI